MDQDRVKGTADQLAGRVKRQVGEWTGDTQAQIEGGAQEVKGTVQKAWGETKDAIRKAGKEAEREAEKDKAHPPDRVLVEHHAEHGKR